MEHRRRSIFSRFKDRIKRTFRSRSSTPPPGETPTTSTNSLPTGVGGGLSTGSDTHKPGEAFGRVLSNPIPAGLSGAATPALTRVPSNSNSPPSGVSAPSGQEILATQVTGLAIDGASILGPRRPILRSRSTEPTLRDSNDNGPPRAALNDDETQLTIHGANEDIMTQDSPIEPVFEVFPALQSSAAAILATFERLNSTTETQEQFYYGFLAKLWATESMLNSLSSEFPQSIKDQLNGLALTWDTQHEELKEELKTLSAERTWSAARKTKVGYLVKEIEFSLDVTRFNLSEEPTLKVSTGDDDEISTPESSLADLPRDASSPAVIAVSISTESGDDENGKSRLPAAFYGGVKETLGAIERVSDVFPPLKSSAAGLLVILEKIDAVIDNRTQFEELLGKFRDVESLISAYPSGLPKKIKERLNGLSKTLGKKCKGLVEDLQQSLLSRIAFTATDKALIGSLMTELDYLLKLAELILSVGVSEQVSNMQNDVLWVKHSMLLGNLGKVGGAAFGHGNRLRCMPGTRIGILSKLLTWATDQGSGSIFWLNGMAGTGKTALTESFCSHLSQRKILGASFFCSIKEDDRKNVQLIIPTLAKELAHFHSGFCQELIKSLQNCFEPLSMDLSDQYKTLIVNPAKKAFHKNDLVVLVVDALDECAGQRNIEHFLKAVLAHKLGKNVKLFLTSRPETVIEKSLGSHKASFQLHKIEDHLVHSDIQMFIIAKLGKISDFQGNFTSWPPQELNILVKLSGKLFIVAFTLTEYIENDYINPFQAFTELCCKNDGFFFGIGQVNELYKHILEDAGSKDHEKHRPRIQACLSLLVSARQPLSVNIYARLLQTDVGTIRALFQSLHSVVQLPEKGCDDLPISIYHASFVDYLTLDQPDCWWCCSLSLSQTNIMNCCFDLMNADLHFGISGATTSYLSNDAQPVPLTIEPALAYACTSWGNHLLAATDFDENLDSIFEILEGFLKEKFLFWLEVLSVLKNVSYASPILHQISLKLVKSEKAANFLRGLVYFTTEFLEPIRTSAPHIYLSALPFSTSNPTMLEFFLPKYPSLPVVHFSRGKAQSAHQILTFEGHTNWVRCIAFSPDGKQIVSVSDDRTMCLWDAQTGHPLLSPLKGHKSWIRAVAWSPNGKYIVSGSADKTLHLWDSQTGDLLLDPIEAHRYGVTSVAISSNSKFILSGSEEGTLCLWDSQTGKRLLNPIKGHTARVTSVALSSNSKYIVSGSDDKTLCLWDVQTGKALLEPIKGHTNRILCVAFSPDNKYIVSGSCDETLCLWDVQTGLAVFDPMEGHTNWVTSVAFSPDGKYILSGSNDRTLRLWNAETGCALLDPIKGHTDLVLTVAFSPNGKYFVSGSADRTLRLWDAQIGQSFSNPVQKEMDVVTSVAFSFDGRYIVSGSDDKTVCLWNAETGQAFLDPIHGHTSSVMAVAFSPDGKFIVSGSGDKTLQLWDSQDGHAILDPIKGHTDAVTSVAFSPNGKYIVSGSKDMTLCIWNTQTGQAFLNPIQGHTSSVTSVAFSPDGQSVVSGSDDKTLHLWNVQTGQPILNPFEGHTNRVRSVAFSPDGKYIVSGSNDGTLRLWDAQTGQALLDPIIGHKYGVTSVEFSPNGKYIASGSDDMTLRLWDSQTGQSLLEPITGHTNWILSLAFSPDGKYIATGSSDKTLCLWDAQTEHLSLDSVEGQVASGIPQDGNVFLHQIPAKQLVIDKKLNQIIQRQSLNLLLFFPSHLSIQGPSLIHQFGLNTAKIEITHFVHGLQWKQVCKERPKVPFEKHIEQIECGM